tara:strand:+ start:215 stop:622 length:408 start_codon:yes stop_codon:yes gene_type:complete
MAVDVWQPSKPVAVSREKLEQYLQVLRSKSFEKESLDAIAEQLPETMQKSDASLMKLQEDQWQAATELDDEALTLLIRFFTLAEMQLPNWDGGQTSPVIYLVKILKQRGSFDAELKRWIKSNTDNRYLPNGAVIL